MDRQAAVAASLRCEAPLAFDPIKLIAFCFLAHIITAANDIETPSRHLSLFKNLSPICRRGAGTHILDVCLSVRSG